MIINKSKSGGGGGHIEACTCILKHIADRVIMIKQCLMT